MPRVFINGKFIGGGEYLAPFAYCSSLLTGGCIAHDSGHQKRSSLPADGSLPFQHALTGALRCTDWSSKMH